MRNQNNHFFMNNGMNNFNNNNNNNIIMFNTDGNMNNALKISNNNFNMNNNMPYSQEIIYGQNRLNNNNNNMNNNMNNNNMNYNNMFNNNINNNMNNNNMNYNIMNNNNMNNYNMINNNMNYNMNNMDNNNNLYNMNNNYINNNKMDINNVGKYNMINNNINMNNMIINNDNMNNNDNNNNMNNNNNINNNNNKNNSNNMNNNIINENNMNNINKINNNNANSNNMNNNYLINNNNNKPSYNLNYNLNALNRPTKENMNNISVAMDHYIKSVNSNPDNNKNIDLNKEISFKFSFKNGQTFNIKAKLSDKFEDIVKKFRESQCPEELKYNLSLAFNKNVKINFDKNIHDNNIKEGDIILFESYMRRNQKNSNKDSEIDLLVQKWYEEYEANQKIEYFALIHNLPEGEEIPPFSSLINKEEFMDFVLQKIKTVGISVSEHQHKLVYCLTNYDWKCDICKTNYSKKDPTYFCSICDYNMCDKCRKEKNYEHSSSFPEFIIPSDEKINKFIDSPLHFHRLAYCRYNFTYVNLSGWNCSLCDEEYEADIWPLYCTQCNFKLCYKCSGI